MSEVDKIPTIEGAGGGVLSSLRQRPGRRSGQFDFLFLGDKRGLFSLADQSCAFINRFIVFMKINS